jgi:hypothetical protein
VIQVDGLPPTTTAQCNGGVCSTGWYTAGVTVTLPGTDTGGSGLATTYYTTDGTTPTTSSKVYSGPISVPTTTTVKYFSVDKAANAEAVRTQVVQIDPTAPTSTIQCNGAACSTSSYTGSVTFTLSAVDNTGGSGVESIHYTTDGTNPTLSSPTYTGPVTRTSSGSVRYRAYDNAGNAEAVKGQSLSVIKDAAPVARMTVTPTSGRVSLVVNADASASTDTDGTPIAKYTFDFGDGSTPVTQTGAKLSHTFTTTGTFTVSVQAFDTANQASNKVNVKVTVSR